MGLRVESHVPARLAERGWGALDLHRELTILLNKTGEKIGQKTCYRLAEGSTDVTLKTAARLCQIFNEPIQRVYEVKLGKRPG